MNSIQIWLQNPHDSAFHPETPHPPLSQPSYSFAHQTFKTDVLVTNTIIPLIGKIFDLVNNKQRVIIICSMIEGDNDIKRNVFDVYDGLKNYFDGVLNVGLLHCKLSDEEKNAEMMKFKNGKTEVLISTTVIEVGVDVK